MKTICTLALLILLALAPIVAAQDRGKQQASAASPGNPASDSAIPDAYYYFTIGHLYEMQFELTGESELAQQATDSYRKALELEPNSAVIMERLAEIYAASQHISDAVEEAQQALKIDPKNVDAHRLLAHIYVRTLGDINAGEAQTENLAKAVEQFEAILELDPTDVNSSLWLARLYRFQNHHEQAAQVLREVLKRDPENGPALEQLSQILIDGGHPQDAIKLLEQAAGDSSSPDVFDLLGDAYSQSKNYPQAEAAYRQAVQADPDEPSHRRGLAQALLAEGKSAEALEQYKKLTALEPGTAENYLRLSQLYRRMGKFSEAESSLLRAKQLSPGSLEILYNEALLYEDQGRYDDAVKVLSDAVSAMKAQPSSESNPSAQAVLYEQLGRAYSEQGNYDAAIQTFQEMAKLGPDSKKRAEMLEIDAYRESRDLDRAITQTQKALGESPNDPDLTVTLAMLYGEKTDTDKATELLKSLLHGSDRDQSIYLDMAQVQERGKKYAEAQQSAEKALQMAQQPSDRESSWFMLGAIYERQKNYDAAEQAFNKALEVTPDNAAVLNYYGYMLADRGVRLSEATSMIQKAVAQEPSNGAYLDSLGWAYYKQNKLAEAEEYLRKAVDRDKHDPTVLGHLGDVYMKMGQKERAAEIWERALAEWQKAVPADYEADKVNELDTQLRNLKRHLAQKSELNPVKPQ